VGTSGGHEEREQTLNQLLVEMDGFEGDEGIIIIAATNRPDVLDKALLRPGRFDRQIEVPYPDIAGREKILEVHMKGKPIADKLKITMREFEDARDKVMMGAERRSLAMSDEEKEMTAYHEAGHAIVGLNMEGSLPIHKATIIPRGRALGMVQYMPERDQISIGPIAYKDTDQQSFHPGIGRGSAISPETAKLIESEIKRFITEAHETAHKVLKKKKKDWVALAEALLEYETLSGDEITVLLSDGIKPKRPDGAKGSKPAVAAVPTTKKKPLGDAQPEA